MKKIIESSCDVFADPGFSPEEVTLLAMRSQLMGELRLIAVPRFRSSAGQVGEVQPGYTDYVGHSGRPAC